MVREGSHEYSISPERGDADGARLRDLVAAISRHRLLAFCVFTAVVYTTGVVTMLLPKRYEATASVLAREGGGGASGLLSGLAATALQQLPGASVPSLTPNRDMIVGVLKSRTVAQAIVDRFRLMTHYKSKFPEDAVRDLVGNTRISPSREGVVSITVEDTDPYLAADIANFYVDQLDRRVLQLGSGEAGRQRIFIAEQLARAKSQLDLSDQALRRVQERNQAVVLAEQTRGQIDAAGRLKGEIIAAEVQLQVLRNFATEANPDVVALTRRVAEMKRQLAQMEYGDGRARIGRPDFYVPFAKVPQVGLELARLTREVKVQETVVTLLTQQLEQAKIAEAKDVPAVLVLDRAVPAQRHSKPKTLLNLAIAGVVGLGVAVFLAFAVDIMRGGDRRRPAA